MIVDWAANPEVERVERMNAAAAIGLKRHKPTNVEAEIAGIRALLHREDQVRLDDLYAKSMMTEDAMRLAKWLGATGSRLRWLHRLQWLHRLRLPRSRGERIGQ